MLIPPVRVSDLVSFWYPFDDTQFYFWCQKEGYDMAEFSKTTQDIGCAIEDACQNLHEKGGLVIDKEFRDYWPYLEHYESFLKDNNIGLEDITWQNNVKMRDEEGDCVYYGRADIVNKKEKDTLDLKSFGAGKKKPIGTMSSYGSGKIEKALFQSFLYSRALPEPHKYGVLILGSDGYTVFRSKPEQHEKFKDMLEQSKGIIARFKKSYFLI